MDLAELKKQYVIGTELGIDESFGRILAVIDFGNVNYWFNEDRQDAENRALKDGETFRIDLVGLHEFVSLFASDARFYYGHDSQKPESLRFIAAARHMFGGKKVFTKAIQKVRHHLSPDELGANTRVTFLDQDGLYVQLPKCNFDVEISVDAIRLLDKYDTLALFSGDADFLSLVRFLRKRTRGSFCSRLAISRSIYGRRRTRSSMRNKSNGTLLGSRKAKTWREARSCEMITRIHGQVWAG